MSYDRYGQQPGQYGQQQQYPYSDSADYNPYGNQQQPYPTYDQGGYNDNYRDDNYALPPGAAGGPNEPEEPVHRNLSVATAPQRQPSNATTANRLRKEGSGNYAERDLAFSPPVNMAHKGPIKQWRRDYHGDMWTRGGTGSCLCRFCFCTIFTAIFLVISIVLSLALWARPPNILIDNAGLITNGSEAIQINGNNLDILLGINITVNNPNFFAMDLKKIQADIFYPLNGNKTAIGNGSESNVDFAAHTNKTFQFPFTIAYQESLDPNHAILADIATKCFGNPKTDLTVDYSLTLTVQIAVIPVNIPITNSVAFACPLQESQISNLLKAAGISIGDLIGSAT